MSRFLGAASDEKPVHWVSVTRFAIGRYEVTFAEYDRFAVATGQRKPSDNGWERANRPVINVSWKEASAYAEWLSEQTGQRYRLPTEAEWEYAARAGTITRYWWGNQIDSERANCRGCRSREEEYQKQTLPVGSFAPNPFGLYDMLGNVWEWTCSTSEYQELYTGKEQHCVEDTNTSLLRVIRGGAWNNKPRTIRAANRSGLLLSNVNIAVGFRLVMK